MERQRVCRRHGSAFRFVKTKQFPAQQCNVRAAKRLGCILCGRLRDDTIARRVLDLQFVDTKIIYVKMTGLTMWNKSVRYTQSRYAGARFGLRRHCVG